jgi:hypothetical protein
MRPFAFPAALTRQVVRALLLTLAVGSAANGAFAAIDPGTRPPAGQGDTKTHKHAWAKATRKEWVPPEKKRVKVGVDAKGRPIYETQIVKPGYWRTVTFQRCACGATKG